MIEFEKEYYKQPYYFYLKNRGDEFSVYFSVSETLVESRQSDEEIKFLKEDFDKVKDFIKNLFNKGIKFTKEQIKKILNWIKGDKNKKKETKKDDKKVDDKDKKNDNKDKKELDLDGEVKEFVGADGSFLGSNVPMLNQRQVTKNTMDQTVRQTKANQFPFIRVYYGESEEEKNNLIDEIDISGWFGGKETEDAESYEEASKILKKMGVKDPFERHDRLETLGFDPEYDDQLDIEQKNGYCKKCISKRRLSELEKGKMQKMIDEILVSKKSKNDGVLKKNKNISDQDSVMSKILVRNIEAIKRLADKEGISIDKLIKHLKTGE